MAGQTAVPHSRRPDPATTFDRRERTTGDEQNVVHESHAGCGHTPWHLPPPNERSVWIEGVHQPCLGPRHPDSPVFRNRETIGTTIHIFSPFGLYLQAAIGCRPESAMYSRPRASSKAIPLGRSTPVRATVTAPVAAT